MAEPLDCLGFYHNFWQRKRRILLARIYIEEERQK